MIQFDNGDRDRMERVEKLLNEVRDKLDALKGHEGYTATATSADNWSSTEMMDAMTTVQDALGALTTKVDALHDAMTEKAPVPDGMADAIDALSAKVDAIALAKPAEATTTPAKTKSSASTSKRPKG